MPRKKKVQEEPVGTILEHMGMADPNAADTLAGGDKPDADGVEVLQKQISDLNKQVDRLTSSQLSLLSSGLGSAVAPIGGTAKPELPSVNLDGLPDQLTDPEGYQKGLNDRLSATIQETVKVVTASETAKVQQDKSYDTKVEGLWSDFTDAHPELSEHTDLVEFAAGAVAKKAQARGLNVEQYMFTTRETFFDDIVTEVNKRFGDVITQAKSEEGDDETPPKETKHVVKGDEPDARTGGVFGGEMFAGTPPKDDKANKPGDFIKDLTDVQRASGFF